MSNRHKPDDTRKFQNVRGILGRSSYSGEPKRRQKVIWSRKYRKVRKVRNEMAFKSRKINRHAR